MLLESLAPFKGWREPPPPVMSLLFEWRYSRFDLAANIVAYAPFGFLLTMFFRRRLPAAIAVFAALACSALVSFGVEVAQLYLPGRVSSKVDLLANVAGSAIGAAIAIVVRRGTLVPSLREKWFVSGNWGDAGIALVALFAICAAKPAVPLFSNLAPNASTLAVVTSATINFTAVALFVSLIARSRDKVVPLVIAFLVAIVALKLLATWLLFRYRPAGLSLESAMGVGYGMVIFLLIFWREKRILPWCVAALLAAFAFTQWHLLEFPYHRGDEQQRYQGVTRLIAEWWALIALIHVALRRSAPPRKL
jgi:VanZ family protein